MSARKLPVEEAEAQTDDLGRMVDRVVGYILERIRSGEYVQGQQLVARNIAKHLDVSIAPVREALHRLSGEDLIELFSNRSARVRCLSRDDILHALEVWEVHAGLMARLAAQRIKIRDNADRLRMATSKLKSMGKRPDPQQYFRTVMRYQEILAEICENPYVDSVRRRLHTEFWTPYILAYLSKADWPAYLSSFESVDAAILSGNPELAEQEYRRHVRWAAAALAQTLPKTPVPPAWGEQAVERAAPAAARRNRR